MSLECDALDEIGLLGAGVEAFGSARRSELFMRHLRRRRRQLPGQQFGQEQAQKARDELRKAIKDAREILGSQRLVGIMNLRNKHLAHSLSETHIERKTEFVAPMQYGDERAILLASLPIVETLHCWVSGKSFSFDNSRDIDRKNAEALWKRCTFNIE